MLTDNEVSQIVADTVRNQLAPCEVEVKVTKGTDDDGDPLLRITIVIEKEAEPDRRKMLGLVRHIQENLSEAVSVGFPLLSFVSKREAAKFGLEAV